MKTTIRYLLYFFVALSFATSCKTLANRENLVVYENSDALVVFAEKQISTIDCGEFYKRTKQPEKFLLIDVRELAEYKKDAIGNAIHIPRGTLEFRIESEKFFGKIGMPVPKKDTPIYVYCEKGTRGTLACFSLKQLGYTKVVNIKNGIFEMRTRFPELIIVPEIME